MRTQQKAQKGKKKMAKKEQNKGQKKIRSNVVRVRTPPRYGDYDSSSDSDSNALLSIPKPKKKIEKEVLFDKMENTIINLMEKFEDEKQDTKRYSAKEKGKPLELQYELDNRLLNEEEIEKKEYELFTKFAYSDTPGLMQEIDKIRKMREHLKYKNSSYF